MPSNKCLYTQNVGVKILDACDSLKNSGYYIPYDRHTDAIIVISPHEKSGDNFGECPFCGVDIRVYEKVINNM